MASFSSIGLKPALAEVDTAQPKLVSFLLDISHLHNNDAKTFIHVVHLIKQVRDKKHERKGKVNNWEKISNKL